MALLPAFFWSLFDPYSPTLCSLFIFNAQAAPDEAATLRYENGNSHINDNYIVRLNEVQWILVREINVEGLIRLGNHFAAGPTLGYMFGGDGIYRGAEVGGNSFYDDETTRYKVGLKAMYTFRHFNESGPYVTGFGRYQSSDVTRQSSLPQEPSVGVSFDETVFGATLG